VESRESIRATVVGAGSYTTTVSGSTIFYSEPLFPQQNLPVLKLTPQEQEKCFEGSAKELSARIQWFLEQVDGTRMVLGLPGVQDPGYEALKRMASSIAGAAGAAMPKDAPLFIVIESDTAKALGQVLFAALGRARPVVVIDAIHVEQNDYVDLGKPLMNGLVIPVIVKTLIFG
jgi:ethanolamine utilization protein EutA